ncbi:MAG: YsnF/AvaK domain-containing protein [Mojavia pulchra JT2-VF2]|jgi:sporulation protein YlmC with PRC-barrel domain|uniref:YsnF/AvaK domain-containing protein n=1 Tax=Mojavia pulchra JT2-VF2 TaxID=287848 RepID=A0A951Q461_9NOST|nr:YsnF/AvaK domain-containing protein [Mojavia pulchra JT2-VF2]
MNGHVALNCEQATKVNINKRISTLLDNLGSKVRKFSVIDRQGQLLGEVQDLVLDANHRLNLVISKQKNQKNRKLEDRYGSFLLRSQRIQKIDNPTKSIFIDIEKSEIENMHENLEANRPDGQIANGQNINGDLATANLPEVEEESIVRLLEERLIINSSQRKVGDVIVRKEIETRMVQVPVRREKLIVEQVSPEHKQLAEIDLGQGEISGIVLSEGEIPEVTTFDNGSTVSGSFSSPKIASLVLNAIALERNHGCKQVRVSIVVENEEQQQKYQEWFDRCSLDKRPNSEK